MPQKVGLTQGLLQTQNGIGCEDWLRKGFNAGSEPGSAIEGAKGSRVPESVSRKALWR
jgi:hypothetical protein